MVLRRTRQHLGRRVMQEEIRNHAEREQQQKRQHSHQRRLRAARNVSVDRGWDISHANL